MAYNQKTEHRLRMRAQIVLHAARGRSNARIVCETGLRLDTVRRLRGRFAEHGLGGLSDRKRSGRPPVFTLLQDAEVKALACQLAAQTSTPLSRWSCPELAREVAARAITGPVSASTLRRWLADNALKPRQYQSWFFIRDPDFGAKAGRIKDLYARAWNGVPLGEDEYVISADEKTSIQARCRGPWWQASCSVTAGECPLAPSLRGCWPVHGGYGAASTSGRWRDDRFLRIRCRLPSDGPGGLGCQRQGAERAGPASRHTAWVMFLLRAKYAERYLPRSGHSPSTPGRRMRESTKSPRKPADS
ncbi:helix-turn-helix domain-containing protein [Streptomyces sp. NPDC002763]|uniref:helix-turn-helix domain-containing protein n=1 Tax=Streptomyces sp. NPDC002763 TaxID=3154427 RepID=UPI003330F595